MKTETIAQTVRGSVWNSVLDSVRGSVWNSVLDSVSYSVRDWVEERNKEV